MVRNYLGFFSKTLISFRLIRGYRVSISAGFAVGFAMGIGVSVIPEQLSTIVQRFAYYSLVLPVSGPLVWSLSQIAVGFLFAQLVGTHLSNAASSSGASSYVGKAVDFVKGVFS